MGVHRIFFNVLSRDLDRATAFYLGLFRFRVTFSSDWFVHLASADEGALELGLLRVDGDVVPETGRQEPKGGMLTLVVDDVDAVHREAVRQGAAVLEAPRNLFYGQRRMLLRDPDGMLLDVSSACDPDPDWAARVRQRDDGAYTDTQ